MLLESALAELSIDLNQSIYADNVVLEMCSPGESLSDQKTPSSKDMNATDSYGTPGSVPFRWEIQPGVPKQEAAEITQVDRSPLRLPPSAYSSPNRPHNSSNGQGYLTWNISPGRRHLALAANISPGRHRHLALSGDVSPARRHLPLSGNISPGRRHLALAASLHRQSVVAEYDGDDESVGGDLDSNEGCSPVSTLGRRSLSPNVHSPENSPSRGCIDDVKISGSAANLAENSAAACPNSGELVTEAAASSAARSCATLLWGVFPCSSKCFFQHKDKNKANGANGPQAAGLSKANSVPSSGLVVFDGVHEKGSRPVVASALKKKRMNSSWGGMKQVRFSVEDTATANGGAPSSVAAASELEWASYGLF